jgi:L-alanine-DL-glutamate epimerase-like enolase superfamily enzyme
MTPDRGSEFGPILDAEAMDFIQPSPAKMGGVTEMRRIFTVADIRSVTEMPRTFYDGPGLFAGIHVTAVLGADDTNLDDIV